MRKYFYLCCWLLIFGCGEDGPSEKLYGNYNFHFESSFTDPFGPVPMTRYWSSDAVGEIVEKGAKLVFKTGTISNFEVEVIDKKFSSQVQTLENGYKVYYNIEGEFDSLDNVTVDYIYSSSDNTNTRHLITGIRIN
jgi:hypothetical protein